METIIKPKLILPCLRGVMGDWVYYVALMNAKQINEWILPAKDIREAMELDDHLQRTLKERKEKIATYLLKRDNRFFNSIIVGVFGGVPDWIDFDLSKADNIVVSPEDMKILTESMGLMIFNGVEKMFAIDGQHRVEGIKIAFEKDTDRKILVDDQFSVLFVAHNDDELGKKRTRQLFSDINKKAVPVAKGDNIIIDEEDLSAIVARRVYSEYSFFEGGRLISLTEKPQLEHNDTTSFTNLLTIYSICKILKPLYSKEKKTKDWDEVNVINLKKEVFKFFDFIIENCQELNSYFIQKKLSLHQARESNKYLLFRPVGILLLAKIYVYFTLEDKTSILLASLNRISFIMPESPFNKILWSNGKMKKAITKSQTLAYKLSLYLLNELNEEEEGKLLENYQIELDNPQALLPFKVI